MSLESRVPSQDPAPRRSASPPFYRVDHRELDGTSRHYVVHTRSPQFLIEFEKTARRRAREDVADDDTDAAAAREARKAPVIRRVCVPNSWVGDYHHCARLLGAAAEFYASTESSQE